MNVINTPVSGTEVKPYNKCPGICKLRIIGIKEEHKVIETFWWVKTDELAKDLCGIVINRQLMPSVSSPSEIFNRYGLICGGHRDQISLLTWVSPNGYAVDSTERPCDDQRWGTYVPLGFSSAVLDLAHKGIVNVTTRKYYTGLWTADDNIPHPVDVLVGHHINGTSYDIIPQGKHGPYNIIPTGG